MGDCQLDDLLDILDDDGDFEEATVDDPGPVEECQEDIEEEGGDEDAEEEMAQKLREMEEEVSSNTNFDSCSKSIQQVRKMKEKLGKKNIKKSDSVSPGGGKIKPDGASTAVVTKKVTEVDLFSSPSSSASKAK